MKKFNVSVIALALGFAFSAGALAEILSPAMLSFVFRLRPRNMYTGISYLRI